MSSEVTSKAEHMADDVAEARIIEHLRGHYNRRLAAKGVVTGDDVIEMAWTTGLSCEQEDLRPLLPDWNMVPYDTVIEAISTIRVTQNAELSTMVRHVEEDVVSLSPLGYLRYKLPCTTKDPSWGYREVRVSFHVAPRHLLFASTGVVLMVTGMAILVLMSFLWLAQANDREAVQMTNFHLLLSSFTESFEQRFFQAHAETMEDQVDTMAKLIEKQQEFREAKALAQVKDHALLAAQLLDMWGASFDGDIWQEPRGALEALRDMFNDAGDLASLLTVDDLVAVIRDWALPSGWEPLALLRGSTGPARVLVETRGLECSYGKCEYESLPCLQASTQATASFLNDTLDVQRRPVVAASITIPRLGVTVCTAFLRSALVSNRLSQLVSALRDINEVHGGPLFSRVEYLLVAPPVAGGRHAVFLSPRLRPEDPCYRAGTCLAVDAAVETAVRTNGPLGQVGTGYSGHLMLIGAAPTVFGYAVAVTLRDDALLESIRQEIVAVVDMMNTVSTRTTELSLGRRDPVTGTINAQINKFRFESTCIGGPTACERIEAAKQNAVRALTERVSGFAITPDYRPAPVLGAFAYIGKRIDMALVIERDVEEIRSIGLQALISIFDDNNAKYTGSLEAQFVRFRGMPPTKVFDRNARCDYIRECVVKPGAGAVYRSDCQHCLRAPEPMPDDIEYLTKLKMLSDCQRRRNCSADALARSSGVARIALNERSARSRSVEGTDYRDRQVLAVYNYVQNFSAGLIVKLDKEEIQGPITQMIGLAVGTAIAIVLLGLVLLIFFSRKVLDKIEYEWLSYKEQIDQEKKKFDNMVKDVIPKSIAEEVARGQKQAATVSNLCFVFLDVCNLSDKTRNWAPEIVCRYLTYILTVVERTARHFALHKIRMFGDTYFAVGGLGDTPTSDVDHASLRVARFAVVMVQLLSPKFAHYPDHIAVIRDTFAEVVNKNGKKFPDVVGNVEDVGNVAMPAMRIGMHYGSGTFCVIETGRTPTYEIFGPSVALAARMQATSQGNRIHLSGATKETIERYDKDRVFEFDAPRKTVVKGQGTITSHFVNSASVSVPADLLEELGVEYANLRVFYEEGQTTTAPAGPVTPVGSAGAAATASGLGNADRNAK